MTKSSEVAMITILAIPFIAFIVLFVSLVVTYPFMWMWNYSVVFALPTIAIELDFWHAYWLVVFLGIFIKARPSNSSNK